MKELVEHAKAKPNQLNVSNPGVGSSNHLGQELLLSLTGMEMQDVQVQGPAGDAARPGSRADSRSAW
jgi:tripartite-type tricarboxylate transporter receptor subunit TctC